MVINYNQAYDEGGGIYLKEAPMHLEYVDVEGNDCGTDGGGIYMESGILSSQWLRLLWNRALGSESWGGGLFVRAGTVHLSISYLGNNTAWDYAGGVICQGVTITALAFAGPQAITTNVVP